MLGTGFVVLSLAVIWQARRARLQARRIGALELRAESLVRLLNHLNVGLVELKHEVRGTAPLTDGRGRRWSVPRSDTTN